MKAIFLDIDGVLNNFNTDPQFKSKSCCHGYIGIDKDKIKRLAKIVNETNAILILISSWKEGWEPNRNYDASLFPHAKYLDNHLKYRGNLIITDKTKDSNKPFRRGETIYNYLKDHPEITSWIVLDDEIFKDYNQYNIYTHLLLTDSNYGLTDKDVEHAIKKLNEENYENN